MNALLEARDELVRLNRELDRARRENQRVAELWTADKFRWQARNRELNSRVRFLERLLLKTNGRAAQSMAVRADLPLEVTA